MSQGPMSQVHDRRLTPSLLLGRTIPENRNLGLLR
jgi:hypothetical protein